MFKNLFDLGYKRTGLEAFGFYIVYTILFIVIGGLANGLAAKLLYPNITTYEEGLKVGKQIGMILIPILLLILSSALTIGMIFAKKINKSIKAWIIAFCTISITVIFGAILGDIPLAVLSTFGEK